MATAENRECVYQAEGEASLTAFDLMALFLRKRRAITIVFLAVVCVTACIAFLLPNQYRSTASLLPSGSQDKFAELKQLAGMGALSMTDENSSELFPTILRSRAVQEPVLARRFSFQDDGKPTTLTLQEYFDQDNPDKLRKALNDITDVGLDKKTGVIELAAETEYPALSQQIVSAYVEELESFNLYKRRSQAKDNAAYLAKQIEAAQADLTKSEDELEAYQMANRNWLEGSSPDLLKELTRLQRQAEIQNKKYLYLSQEYEIAKLDAQKDVPIVRVLDKPSLPVLKSSPHRLLLVAGSGTTALFATLFLLTLVEVIRRRSADGTVAHGLGQQFAEAFPRVAKMSWRVAKVLEREQLKS